MYGVLVLVEVDDGVRISRHLVGKSGNGGALDVRSLGVSIEKGGQRDGKLRLSCSFLAVYVKQRKEPGLRLDDVAKECGEIEAETYLAIVAEHFCDERHIIFHRELNLRIMDKPPLVTEKLTAVPVHRRKGWQIEILVFQTDDAVIINGVPVATIYDAIRESIETALAIILPAQLLDLYGCLAMVIQVKEKPVVLFLPTEEYI